MSNLTNLNVYEATSIASPRTLDSRAKVVVIGAGNGSYLNQLLGPFSSLSSIEDYFDFDAAGVALHGRSAIYRWAEDYFRNGGTNLYVVEADKATEQTDSSQTGDGTTKKYTIAGLTIHPVPGTVKVNARLASEGAARDLVENTDYIVDYSNGDVVFKEGIFAAATITFKWQEHEVGDLNDAFGESEALDFNVTSAAYCYNVTLQARVLAHIVSTRTAGLPRVGFCVGEWNDATTILTTATTLDDKDVSLWANRSGYYNDNLTDPTENWKEFRDISALACGYESSQDAWTSLHNKTVYGSNWTGQFNSTDLGNLTGAYVNVLKFKSVGSANNLRMYQGWVLDSSRDWKWVDERRLWAYIKQSMEVNLDDLFGKVAISGPDIEVFAGSIMFILNDLYNKGAIENPAELFDTHERNPIDFPVLDAFRKAAADRTDLEQGYINAIRVTRNGEFTVWYNQRGWLHSATVYLGKV